jgi:hypothetical protein
MHYPTYPTFCSQRVLATVGGGAVMSTPTPLALYSKKVGKVGKCKREPAGLLCPVERIERKG